MLRIYLCLWNASHSRCLIEKNVITCKTQLILLCIPACSKYFRVLLLHAVCPETTQAGSLSFCGFRLCTLVQWHGVFYPGSGVHSIIHQPKEWRGQCAIVLVTPCWIQRFLLSVGPAWAKEIPTLHASSRMFLNAGGARRPWRGGVHVSYWHSHFVVLFELESYSSWKRGGSLGPCVSVWKGQFSQGGSSWQLCRNWFQSLWFRLVMIWQRRFSKIEHMSVTNLFKGIGFHSILVPGSDSSMQHTHLSLVPTAFFWLIKLNFAVANWKEKNVMTLKQVWLFLCKED